MDITSKNFESSLKIVLDAINECDFVSFDTELTGLDTNPNFPFSSNPPHPRNMMESLEERYQFVLKSSAGYQIIQFGLCAYTFDAENERYTAKPFNFYLFSVPQTSSCGTVDKRFLMQSSSVMFLAQHNFDFNKWIYEGIPYLTRPEESFLNGKGPNEVQLGLQDIEFVNQACKVIDKWKSNNLSGEYIELPPSNAFLRRILYQELPKKYNDLHLETVDSSTIKGIKIMRISKGQRANTEEKVQVNPMFRQVIDSILSSKKPIIGHNMLLDTVHLLNNFVSPLPQTLKEFKEMVNAELGTILDTKHLAKQHPVLTKLISNTGLSEAYHTVCQEPFSQSPEIYTPPGFDKYSIKNADDSVSHKGTFHEAGFDAFATGNLFIRMAHKVLQSHPEGINENGKSHAEPEFDGVSPILSHFSQFVNRIPVVRSDSVIFLQGEDEVPDRSLVAYVFGFPEATTTNDLLEYFKKYTVGGGSPRVSWIDIQSCFVGLKGNGSDPENGITETNVWDHITRPDATYKAIKFEDYKNGNFDGKSKKRPLEKISNGDSHNSNTNNNTNNNNNNGKDNKEDEDSSESDSTYTPSQSDTTSESEGSVVPEEEFNGLIKDVNNELDNSNNSNTTEAEENEETENESDTKRRKKDRSSCIIS